MRMVKVGLVAVLLLGGLAQAWDRREVDFYRVRTPGKNTSYCAPGDEAVAGGVKCPQPLGTHSFVTGSFFYQKSGGLQGWRANCLTTSEDPTPVFVEVECLHESCVPGDAKTCEP